MSQITAIVPMLNEVKRVRRCIESLLFCEKLVLIDSFSEDDCVEVARKVWISSGRLPVDLLILARSWRGFTEMRNESLKWVQTPWALWVDADEWVSKELREELESIKNSTSDSHSVYKMPRQSFFLNRAIRHGGWYPDRKARFAKAQSCYWLSGPRGADVHEDLVSRDARPVALLSGHIYHEPFLDQAEQNNTNLRYSQLLAEALYQKHLQKKRHRGYLNIYIILKVCIKFVENYVFKRGFLDGRPGLLIAIGSAQSLRWRLLHVNLLHRRSGNRANSLSIRSNDSRSHKGEL